MNLNFYLLFLVVENDTIKDGYNYFNKFTTDNIVYDVLKWLFFALMGAIFAILIRKLWRPLIAKIRIKYFQLFDSSIKIEDYFHLNLGDNAIDMACYQFGLRPKLPLMDVLYLELLNKQFKDEKIKKIIVFPTIDTSFESQTKEEFKRFKQNVNCILKNCDVEFVDPYRKSELTSREIIDKDFIDSILYLGDKEFYKGIKIFSGIEVSGIQDFNVYHKPEKIKPLAFITHVFKAWEVREYILKKIESTNKSDYVIGFLFWEVEYDKWGIYEKIGRDERVKESNIMLGKTQLDKDGIPIPVFNEKAINIFDRKEDLLSKINDHTKDNIKKLMEIVTSILQDNYNEVIVPKEIISMSNEYFKRADEQKVLKNIRVDVKDLNKEVKVLYRLVSMLRSKYEC